jgi:hypothetical protein
MPRVAGLVDVTTRTGLDMYRITPLEEAMSTHWYILCSLGLPPAIDLVGWVSQSERLMVRVVQVIL